VGKTRPGLESDMIVVRIKKKEKSGKAGERKKSMYVSRGWGSKELEED
jgi:hypothetical protein